MELSSYVVELLRLHECVIVPDLGGFVANYRPAEMDLASNSFNPPVKEVIFSPKLSKNDGLLVNYLSEMEGVGYMEARQMISEYVDEVWSRLENGELIEFQRIGTLQYDSHEKLIFEPAVHENFLLDAFGLEGFQFPTLERDPLVKAKRVLADKEAVRPVFNSRRVKALTIGLPLVLALIFIPITKYNWKGNVSGEPQITNTASLPPTVDAPSTHIAHADSMAAPTEEAKPIAPEAAPAKVETREETVAVNAAESGRYRVIGGCFKVRENAEHFLSSLQKEGFQSEMKMLPGGSFLVVVQSYANRAEALTALRSLRKQDPKTGYFLSAN